MDEIVRNLTYLYCAASSCMQAFRTWQPTTLRMHEASEGRFLEATLSYN